MIAFLEIIWIKFKALHWGWKIVVVLPAIVAITLALALLIGSGGQANLFREFLKKNKKQVDKKVEKALAEVKELEKKEERLKEQQEDVEKEIKANEEIAKKLSSDVDSAVANDDIDELNRIRKKLNKQSETRRFKTSRPPKS